VLLLYRAPSYEYFVIPLLLIYAIYLYNIIIDVGRVLVDLLLIKCALSNWLLFFRLLIIIFIWNLVLDAIRRTELTLHALYYVMLYYTRKGLRRIYFALDKCMIMYLNIFLLPISIIYFYYMFIFYYISIICSIISMIYISIHLVLLLCKL